MNIFYLLIGVSLLAALIFLGAFIWAVRNGQFDDNETPAIRMLFDDDKKENEEEVKDIKKKEKKN
jgi:cbb3-type cytochrome oxidase maturation protein